MASAKRDRQRARLRESAAVTEHVRTELVDLDEASIRPDGTAAIKVISPGWGTSGYYSPEVLEAAGTSRVFPAGTQMFWDHPTEGERPERSLRNLAAVLETDATWRADHPNGPGLYAQAKVFEAYRPLLKEMAPHIGVSVRAGAEVSTGEAEGRRGRIIERMVAGESVDFVTKAGRGGQILAVLEAAGRTDLIEEARNWAEWCQSRIHLDFTTRADDAFGEGRLTKEERIALSNAIGAALDAFNEAVTEKAPQLYERDPWAEAPAPTISQEENHMPITPEERTAIASEAAAAVLSTLTEAGVIKPKADPSTETTEISEAEAAANERADRAEEALLVKSAGEHVAANAKVQGLPAVTRTRLVESLAKEAKAGDDGKLDTKALDEAIGTAVDAEVKYLAEATGSPVIGVGDGDPHLTSDKVDEALARELQELGLSEEAAKAAVAEIA